AFSQPIRVKVSGQESRLPLRISSGVLKLVSSITTSGTRYRAAASSSVAWMARRLGLTDLDMALAPQLRVEIGHQNHQDRAQHHHCAGRTYAHLAAAEGEVVHEHRR